MIYSILKNMRIVIFILYVFAVLFFSLLLYGISAAFILYKKMTALGAKKFEAEVSEKKSGGQKDRTEVNGLTAEGRNTEAFARIEGKERLCIIVSSILEDAEKEVPPNGSSADCIILYTEDEKKFTFGLGGIKKLKQTARTCEKRYKPENVFVTGVGLGCRAVILFRKTVPWAGRIPHFQYRFINMPPDPAQDLISAYKKITGKISPLSPFVILGIKIIDCAVKVKHSRF